MKRELLDKYINRLRKRGDVIDVPMYCPVTGACSPYLFLYSSLSLTASFPLAYLLFFLSLSSPFVCVWILWNLILPLYRTVLS